MVDHAPHAGSRRVSQSPDHVAQRQQFMPIGGQLPPASSHNIFDPVDFGAVRGSVSASQRSANVAAIQDAADAAAIAEGILEIRGAFEIDGTVQWSCNVDGRSGVVRVFDTSISPVVLVGFDVADARLDDKYIILPCIEQAGKTGQGWPGTDTGLEIANTYSCQITVQQVTNFSTSIRMTSYGTGNVYNNVFLGNSQNGKVGIELAPQDEGAWVNENVFIGGRFQINSDEGSNIPGARHVLISPANHPVNNNLFIKPSLEGSGPEYHVDTAGVANTFLQARWEATPPKVYLNAGSADHAFILGYGAFDIAFTRHANGDHRVTVQDRFGSRVMATSGDGGALVASNATSASKPVVTVMPTGTYIDADPATEYVASISQNASRYKRQGDTAPRLELDHQSARLNFGSGAAAPDTCLRRYGTTGLQTDRKLLAEEGIGVGNSTPATTPGNVTGKVEIFDANGVSLGFIPVYDSIT